MYNSKHIKAFIEKVTKEAEEAAQKVFDSYTPELIERIKNQMKNGDKLYIGMGACSSSNDNVNEDFLNCLSATQYTTLEASFILDNINK